MPRRLVLHHVTPCPRSSDPNRKFANRRSNGWRINQVRQRLVQLAVPARTSPSRLAEESELSTDDIFWSKQEEDLQQQQMQAVLYPSLPALTSPPSQQHKTLTPSTPAPTAQQVSTPNALMKSSPSSIGTLRARTHNFISRNILIPETCCVVSTERDDASFVHLLLVSRFSVPQTDPFRQTSLPMPSLQRSVSYGLQGELRHALLTECQNTQSRRCIEIHSTRSQSIASAGLALALHQGDRTTWPTRSGHLSTERVRTLSP